MLDAVSLPTLYYTILLSAPTFKIGKNFKHSPLPNRRRPRHIRCPDARIAPLVNADIYLSGTLHTCLSRQIFKTMFYRREERQYHNTVFQHHWRDSLLCTPSTPAIPQIRTAKILFVPQQNPRKLAVLYRSSAIWGVEVDIIVALYFASLPLSPAVLSCPVYKLFLPRNCRKHTSTRRWSVRPVEYPWSRTSCSSFVRYRE